MQNLVRYPRFAETLKQRGGIDDTIQLFGVARTQAIQYREGRALPKAEKLIRHPDLLDAARRDVTNDSQVDPIAA